MADMDIYDFYKSYGAVITNSPDDFIGTNGCYLYNEPGKQENNDKYTRKNQYSFVGQDLVLAPHEGIVSSDIWLKCRIKCLNNRQSASTGKGKNSWLVGKVKCNNCGYALTIRKSNTRANRYFICTSKSTSIACPGAGTVYASTLEDIVLSQIKAKLKEFQSLALGDTLPVNPKINQIKSELASISGQIDNWIKQAESADGAFLRIINDKVNLLYIERKELEEELFTLNHDTLLYSIGQITDFVDKWDETDIEDKKRIVDALIKVIKVGDGDVNIVFKF
jgi:hypothetical protein